MYDSVCVCVYLDNSIHGSGLGRSHETLYFSAAEVSGPEGKVLEIDPWAQFLVLSHLRCVYVEYL